MSVITDPWFYAVAIPAVCLVGLSKGGLGGAMALLGVPLMALVISPVQAAAIMLPILIVMDIVSLWAWRGNYDRESLVIMLPAGLVGIAIGWFTASWVTVPEVRLIVGVVAMGFALRYVWTLFAAPAPPMPHRPWHGRFWGMVTGFTSFVSHAGGPPYQAYTLPLRQDPKIYTGTSVIFFSVVNAVKLIPYFALGQFDSTNLVTSAVLAPIAPVATLAGAFLVRRMRGEIFYPFMYALMAVTAVKLIWDGVSGL